MREKKNWTQEYAAKKIGHGITKTILSNIESGRSELQAKLVPEVCRAYEITPNQLFENAIKQDRSNSKNSIDMGILHHYIDEDIWQMILYIAQSPYFHLSVMECAAIVICDPKIKAHMHYVNWHLFKDAYNNNMVIDNHIAKNILQRESEFLNGCNDILKY